MNKPKENEVRCWAFGVGNPSPWLKASRDAVKYISTLEGLLGIHPSPPKGTLLIFDTENNAKIAMNLCKSKGIRTGGKVGEVFVEKQYLEK